MNIYHLKRYLELEELESFKNKRKNHHTLIVTITELINVKGKRECGNENSVW